MAEHTEIPPREGWGVASRGGLLLAAGFFGVLFAILAAAFLFYRLVAGQPYTTRPQADPPPRLRTYQRNPDANLPRTEAGPPEPTSAQARAIDAAMRALATRGEAGWAPLAAGGRR